MKVGVRSAEAVLKMIDEEELDGEAAIAYSAIYSRFDQSVCIQEGKSAIKGVIFDLEYTLL